MYYVSCATILGEIENGQVDLSIINFSKRDENIFFKIASEGTYISMTPWYCEVKIISKEALRSNTVMQ